MYSAGQSWVACRKRPSLLPGTRNSQLSVCPLFKSHTHTICFVFIVAGQFNFVLTKSDVLFFYEVRGNQRGGSCLVILLIQH
jgi:hypothetical protein